MTRRFERGRENKKTPPPVPTKRSTLSVRKTVTQQLREREREKEKEREKEEKLKDKEREQQKNEVNARKKNASNASNKVNLGADEFITTEEVLKQSKYVKTYIKNPDPYFVYDPTVLARLKFEELRDIAGKIPKRKQQQQPNQSLRELKTHAKFVKNQNQNQEANKPKTLTFKKCSKPNYPELANLKIRTGTDSNGDYFNPAEVTKNAKKFDERVKKLQISSDDDLDEIDGPLTKSESSDELNQPSPDNVTDDNINLQVMSSKLNGSTEEGPSMGTFTNTISSEEFQAYLERKGLALMPKRDINSPTPTLTPTTTPTPKSTPTPTRSSGYQTAEERRQQVAESLAALRKSNTKKLSVLQRLSNSLFAPRRKTTPKGTTPMPRTVYGDGDEHRKCNTPAEMRRILLESQANGRAPLRTANPEINGSLRGNPRSENNTENVTPFQRSMERQSLIPRRVSPDRQLNRFNRSASMDRNQIKLHSQRQPSRLETVGQRRSLASSSGLTSDERINYPIATSTPLRKALEAEAEAENQQLTVATNGGNNHQNEWEQLRAIKEVTDRQLYHKVLQQQQQQQQQQGQLQLVQQSEENIYEHLQPNQLMTPYFVRGSLQRNTFSGISGRNRQLMILDGNPVKPQAKMPQVVAQQQQHQQQQQPPPRCQSVLDELITTNPISNQTTRRGYESENETPVILRRKESSNAARRIGGLLTRDEILEKVKEFCRKSINRTPLPSAASKMQPIYERHNNNGNISCADISPVSYASVETNHKRPASQLSARPQVPLRVQSLPRSSFAPIGGAPNSVSPIYAHVNKRNSLMSNESEQYLSSQQLPQQRGTIPDQYVLIQTEDGLQAAKLVDYHSGSVYMQPQLLRAPQGYVRIEELAMVQQQQQQQQLQQQQLQQQLQLQQQQHQQQLQLQQHGRATPLILDRSTQHASQIYWTPQHQRLHQLSLPKSPRRAAERMHPVPAPRLHHTTTHNYVLANGQPYATVVPAPRSLMQQQQQQHNNRQQLVRNNTSDWDCSSEAGEVRRIMEKSL
ncbi:hypothetical protein ACLKA6_009978 [Drosophila palustris]